MKFIIGQKFTIRMTSNGNRLCDMHILKVNDRGSFVIKYAYHSNPDGGSTVNYSEDNMNGYFRDNHWVLVSNTMPNTLPEELFEI